MCENEFFFSRSRRHPVYLGGKLPCTGGRRQRSRRRRPGLWATCCCDKSSSTRPLAGNSNI